MVKEDFFKIIIRKDGKLNPKLLNENYFSKNNIEDLWNFFIKETENLTMYSNVERIQLYKQNILHPRKCKCCDNYCMVMRNVYSYYCSTKCSQKDSDRAKLAAAKRNNAVANEKRKHTMYEKYGVQFNSQRQELKHIWKKSKVSENAFEKLNDKEWLYQQYVELKRTSVEIARDLNIYYGTVCGALKQFDIPISYRRSTSTIETEIIDYIKSKNILVEQSNKTIIKPKEIDIFVPDFNLGIEVNGVYWHSYSIHETSEEKNYHKLKYELAKSNNVTVLQFTDLEWYDKQDIVKSMITSRLNLSEKLDARKCIIKKISNEEYRKFVSENHISGYARSNHTYALAYHNEIVSVISLSKSRFDNNADWEIIRFCSKLYTNVRGAFSKLLKHAIGELEIKSLGTYSDNRYGTGNVYLNNGFEHIRSTQPGYCWANKTETFNRYLTQKSKLKEFLKENYDDTLTEADNMFNNKFRRIWDCGHEYFIIEINHN